MLTKAEFERLITAGKNQPVTPQMRTSTVQGVAQVMAFDDAAEKRGLEKDADVQTQLQIAHMRALAQALQQRLIQSAQQVSQDQIDEYYKQHKDDFVEVKAMRLFIPKIAAGQNIDPAKAKVLAETLQKSAAAGQNFDDLEKQAFSGLGLQQQQLPPTDMGVLRHRNSPTQQQDAVFKLAPGEVSEVVETPSAFEVYKAVTKTELPETNVTNEIKNAIAQKNMAEQLRSIFEPVGTTLNPDYFNGMKTVDLTPGGEGDGRPLPPRGSRPPQE